MADYNIWIRGGGDGTSGGGSDRTSPWESGGDEAYQGSQAKPWGETVTDGLRAAAKAGQMIANPDSIVGKALGVASKALPWVVAAAAVVKISDAIATTHLGWYANATGDYSGQLAMSNYHAVMGNVMKPYSWLQNKMRVETEWYKQNVRNQQYRLLLGDAVINGGEVGI